MEPVTAMGTGHFLARTTLTGPSVSGRTATTGRFRTEPEGPIGRPIDMADIRERAVTEPASQQPPGRVGRRVLAPVGAAAVVAVLLLGAVFALRDHGGARPGAQGRPPVLHLAVNAGALSATSLGGERPGHPNYLLAAALPPGQPAPAAAYRFAGGPAPEALVRRLARTLGLTEKPQHANGIWMVSSPPRLLTVQDTPGWPWSLQGLGTVTRGPVMCIRAPCPGPGAGDNPNPQDPVRGLRPPAPAEAKRLAETILGAVGLPADDLSTTTYLDSVDVRAPRRVGGLEVHGLATDLLIGSARQVRSGDGWLGKPQRGAKYPLVSATEALQRLQARPQVQSHLCRTQPGGGCAQPPPEHVTGARIGLMVASDAHGALLVPAWLFTVAGRTEPEAVVAIATKYLGSAPAVLAPTGPGYSLPPGQPSRSGAGK